MSFTQTKTKWFVLFLNLFSATNVFDFFGAQTILAAASMPNRLFTNVKKKGMADKNYGAFV